MNARPAPSATLLALVLGALSALGPLSIDMYLPSLPAMARDLGTTASAAQLTLAAYFAGLGIGQLFYGPLTDRLGRKRPLYAGLALYVLASIGCGLAPSAGALIAFRFLQALGGAAGPVITRAVVRDLYGGADAARLLSHLMLVMGVAPIVAPLVGGWVMFAAGWRAVFAILAVAGVACLALMLTSLPETARGRGGHLRLGAVAGQFGAVTRDPGFLAHTLAGAFGQAAMFAYISGSPFVLIELFGVSPQAYGWFFGANAFALIFASQVNRRLLRRRAPARILGLGTMAITAVGALLGLLAITRAGGLAAVAVSLFAFLASLGFINSNATALAMEDQGERAGVASAALGAIQFGIAAAASSLVGALNDGTMRPMAFVMAGCGMLAWVSSAVARRGAGLAVPQRA